MTQAYDDLIHKYLPKPKEQDMCKEEKRWSVLVEPHSGGSGYYVRFKHSDKNIGDELSRVFETFEQALNFANSTYKQLK